MIDAARWGGRNDLEVDSVADLLARLRQRLPHRGRVREMEAIDSGRRKTSSPSSSSAGSSPASNKAPDSRPAPRRTRGRADGSMSAASCSRPWPTPVGRDKPDSWKDRCLCAGRRRAPRNPAGGWKTPAVQLAPELEPELAAWEPPKSLPPSPPPHPLRAASAASGSTQRALRAVKDRLTPNIRDLLEQRGACNGHGTIAERPCCATPRSQQAPYS